MALGILIAASLVYPCLVAYKNNMKEKYYLRT
jgi:hypothetical protein